VIRPSTRHDGERQYTGVLRRGRTIVAECGHLHRNRTDSSATEGRSALDCATDLLAAARGEALAVATETRIRGSWQHRQCPSVASVERARADAAAAAVDYLARVEQVRGLIAAEPAAPVDEPCLFEQPRVDLTALDDPAIGWMFE
jgi:hypothetical protein